MPRQILGQLVEHLAENLGDPCLGVDREGRLHFANPAAMRLLGLGTDFKGHKIWDRSQVPEFTRVFSRVLKEPGKDRREHLLALPSQRAFMVEMSIVRGSEGRMAGAVAVLREVSAVQQIEQDLTMVIERISQEFKKPLTSVKGYVETLMEGAYSDPVICRRFLQVINDETNRMTRLLVALMDASGGQREPVVFSQVNWVAVTRQVLDRLAPVARQKGIALHLDLPQRADVHGYADHLAQVVTNLLDNALKYTGIQVGREAGHVWLSLGVEAETVRLMVRDDGIGIEVGEQEAVFERFYRVTSGPAAQLGGTGLGLAIVRDLVTAHHGRVHLVSQPGQGSTFTVDLPREAPKH